MVGLGPSGGCGWLAGEDVGRKEDVACVDGGGGEDIVVRRRVVFVALALAMVRSAVGWSSTSLGCQ
jgi:hypothetical protein